MMMIYRCLRRHQCFTRLFSTSTDAQSKKTHFGFETVDEDEKSGRVYHVFENVANRYDLMNDLMSFGIHRLWKDNFVRSLNPSPSIRLLDVAGGTGDIAFRVLRHIEYRSQRYPHKTGLSSDNGSGLSPSFEREREESKEAGNPVTICDISKAMLDIGQKKAKELGVEKGITWVEGDAEGLPFKDGEFDAYTIAFGIRNCTHINKVLSEAHRVLRRGGRFMCLEFSPVPAPIISSVYDMYSFQMIPVMGQVFAGDWNSYQYLVESIRQFPEQEEFAQMIRSAGFQFVTYKSLSFGIVAIHSGFKL